MALEDQLTGSVPFSFEAEQSVLGAVIIDYSVLDMLIPLSAPNIFTWSSTGAFMRRCSP